jgi:AcrR family transcriptional regulator
LPSEKKRKILESTLEIVKEHGFHGCPMSAVAKNGGVAVGTIYHYFEGKDELIHELYHYVVDLICAAAMEGDDGSKTFKERYYDLWENLVKLYCEKPSILKFFELYNNSSYYSPEVHSKENKFNQWLFNFFGQGLESGYLRPLNKEVLAVLVLGNITTCAKVKLNHILKFIDKGIDLSLIADIVWEGIRNKERKEDPL